MIKQRTFLQFAGSTLVALGWSQLALERQSLRYASALALIGRAKHSMNNSHGLWAFICRMLCP
ncbi:MAG: hypothetical protein MJA27_18325 [Pseudanabaenales cyanobacterium]|nr:hypothetical protein [Pseudanabaenales cyanobacterium]